MVIGIPLSITRVSAGAGGSAGSDVLFGYNVGDPLPPGATFTRNSLASYRDSTGLLRYAPHNLVLDSQEAGSANWTKSNTTVLPNAVAAPDLSLTGETVTETAGGDLVRYLATSSPPIILGVSYTASIYIKPAGVRPCLYLQAQATPGGGFGGFFVNLTTMTIMNYFNGISSGGAIEAAGNGWFRLTLSFVAGSGNIACVFLVGTCLSPANQSYIGVAGTPMVHVWGAQLERNISASKYVPTTSTARFDSLRDEHYALDPGLGFYVRTLLLEGARTNLFVGASDLRLATEGGLWSGASGIATASTSTLGPDGTPCRKLIFASGDCGLYQPVSGITVGSGAYSISVFFKYIDTQVVFLRTLENAFVEFNLVSKTFTITPSVAVTARMEDWGNGWVRCSIYGAVPAAVDNNVFFGLRGTAGQSVNAAAAQFELGPVPSSYIPTTSAAVTRAADVLSCPYPGNPEPLSLYVKGVELGTAFWGNNRLAVIGAFNPGLQIAVTGVLYRASIWNSPVGITAAAAPAVGSAYGDTVEVIAKITEYIECHGEQAINGGVSELLGPAGGDVAPLPATWSNFIHIGHAFDGTTGGAFAFRQVIVSKGVKDMAYFRKLVATDFLQDILFHYSAGDSLSGATFTRAAAATYKNSAGLVQTAASGVPRDAHYVNGKRTLLLEGARTNQCLDSEDFSAITSWAGANQAVSIAVNTTSGPNGGSNADTVTILTGTGVHQVAQISGVLVDNTAYSLSIWLKAGTGRYFTVSLGDAAHWVSSTIDLSNGTVTQVLGAVWAAPIAKVEPWGNGWYRCSISWTVVGIGSSAIVLSFTNVPTFTPDQYGRNNTAVALGNETYFLWGCQLEVGPFVSSYIPTTSAAVTRAADSLTIPIDFPPQELSEYVRLIQPANGLSIGASTRIVLIGSPSFLDGLLLDYYNGGTNRVYYYGLSGNAEAATPEPETEAGAGDTMEFIAGLSGGVASITRSVNGDAQFYGYTPPRGMLTAWSSNTIHIGSVAGDGYSFPALRNLIITKGTKDLAYFRALVGP